MTEDELDAKITALAETVVDAMNRDAETPDAPVMLTSFVLVVEGNGWNGEGERITRGFRQFHGSASQAKGLLIDTLDDLRGQDLRHE